MKVLHLSTWQEVCGIAEYAKNLVRALDDLGIENEVFPLRRQAMRYMSLPEIDAHFAAFCDRAADFDVVHIQHEHGFFCGSHPFSSAIPTFGKILDRLQQNRHQRTVVTFHTDPPFPDRLRLSGMSLKAIVKERAKTAYHKWLWRRHVSRHFARPQRDQFQAIVHSKRSRLRLLASDFAAERIAVIEHGLPNQRRTLASPEAQRQARQTLDIPDDAVVLSIFGFVSAYKGYDVAIQALSRLPEHYYLIIAGGPHPEADMSETTLQDVLSLIERLEADDACEISHRILITGFVPLAMLDTIHAATDFCLAPYWASNISASGAVAWAIASGKPTIASRIPAFRELNEMAECFLMFQPSAPLELAWQILNLQEDKQLQADLVNRANAFVEAYSWPSVAKRISHLYKPEH